MFFHLSPLIDTQAHPAPEHALPVRGEKCPLPYAINEMMYCWCYTRVQTFAHTHTHIYLAFIIRVLCDVDEHVFQADKGRWSVGGVVGP